MAGHGEADARLDVVHPHRDALGDEARGVGRRAGDALEPGRCRRADAVDAERAPVVAVEVERHQVPPVARRHQPVRLDVTASGAVVAGAVVEAQPVVAPGGLGQRHQHPDVGRSVGVVRAPRPPEAHRHLAEGVDPLAQRAGHDLEQLGQGGDGGLAERRFGGPRQLAQPERDGHRLVVVEQQRGQPTARAEGVPAVAPGRALDRVPEVAEAGHVAPQGASGDLQTRRSTRPLTRTDGPRTGRGGGAAGPVCRCDRSSHGTRT